MTVCELDSKYFIVLQRLDFRVLAGLDNNDRARYLYFFNHFKTFPQHLKKLWKTQSYQCADTCVERVVSLCILYYLLTMIFIQIHVLFFLVGITLCGIIPNQTNNIPFSGCMLNSSFSPNMIGEHLSFTST